MNLAELKQAVEQALPGCRCDFLNSTPGGPVSQQLKLSYHEPGAHYGHGMGQGVWVHKDKLMTGWCHDTKSWEDLGPATAETLIAHCQRFVDWISAECERYRQDARDVERRKLTRGERLPRGDGAGAAGQVHVFVNWEGRSYRGPWTEDVNIALDVAAEHALGQIKFGSDDVGLIIVAPAAQNLAFHVRNCSCSGGPPEEENESEDWQEEARAAQEPAFARSRVLAHLAALMTD